MKSFILSSQVKSLCHNHDGDTEASRNGLRIVVDPELQLESGADVQLRGQVSLPVPVDARRELVAGGEGARPIDQGTAPVHDLLGERHGDDGLQVVRQHVEHVGVDVQVRRVVGWAEDKGGISTGILATFVYSRAVASISN